jgi:N utilization substance protein B
MGQRRMARQRALQILYASEATGYELTDTVVLYTPLRDEVERNPKPIDQFTYDLVETFIAQRKKVDQALEEALINWRFDRLSAIDRNILRLAVTELLFFEDIPPRVTINEFIEVAKDFSDDESAHFINGVLDRVARSEHFDLANKEEKVKLEGEGEDQDGEPS